MGFINSYTDLKVWQAAHQLILEIYTITKQFPSEEKFGLTSQMRRAAVSITSNIAEGFSRESIKEKLHFYVLARGSLVELENQVFIARDISMVASSAAEAILEKSPRCISFSMDLFSLQEKGILTPNF